VETKEASFGVINRACSVNYVIVGDFVYFTQTCGAQSSINGAEEIITNISDQEEFDWRNFHWVDLQTTPRYSKCCQDELVLDHTDNLPLVLNWQPILVPNEVFHALALEQ
jgi:hypothetical protein